MKVPILDLSKQHAPLMAKFNEAFNDVLNSNMFILGQQVDILEQAMAEYLGVKHAIGVSSGTDALILPLMALDIKPGDEVLCPSFTFFATAGSIVRLGATPVFVDSDEADFNISIEDLKSKITDKTKAIIPVHLFGQSANITEIIAIAKENKLRVIEDTAQAMGAQYHGKRVGGFGDYGAFSFFPTKNLGAFGDAGLVTTNDDELAHKARIMRVHGSEPKYFHKYVGGNFRIDALQAALLNIKLPYIDSYIEKRRSNAAYYLEQLNDISASSGLILPQEMPNAMHTWNQFTIRVVGDKNRDDLKKFLADNRIGSEIYYPLSLHEQECFKGISKGGETIRVCNQMSKECLSIPIYPELERSELDEVISCLKRFFA